MYLKRLRFEYRQFAKALTSQREKKKTYVPIICESNLTDTKGGETFFCFKQGIESTLDYMVKHRSASGGCLGS